MSKETIPNSILKVLPNDNENEIIINESIGYFDIHSNDIDFPFKISSEKESLIKNLEGIYTSIYDQGSTSLAKSFSKEERERKNAKGLSFVYSEIVSIKSKYII